MTTPTKGCDYKPCQDAVCSCNPYCCATAWGLSCCGYNVEKNEEKESNYFVSNCSAKILCCEPEAGPPIIDESKSSDIYIKIFFSKTSAKLAAKTSKKYVKASKSTKGLKSTIAIKAKTSKGKGKGNFTKNTANLAMNVTDWDWLDWLFWHLCYFV